MLLQRGHLIEPYRRQTRRTRTVRRRGLQAPSILLLASLFASSHAKWPAHSVLQYSPSRWSTCTWIDPDFLTLQFSKGSREMGISYRNVNIQSYDFDSVADWKSFGLILNPFFWRESSTGTQGPVLRRHEPRLRARPERRQSCSCDPGGWYLWQTLQGSFSAASKRNFAKKYALESSRRDLHTALLCTARIKSENHGNRF